ncbi:hypothetical protein [Terrimicrobium sacchariphilum]|nr:hypothetical protein [Terrimicrobium sacchariphilum]
MAYWLRLCYRTGMGIVARCMALAIGAAGMAASAWAQAVDPDQTYTVPIYVTGSHSPANYQIYVSQNADGSDAVPYLFDTGSPNMFTVQGTNTSIAPTNTFVFGDGDPVYGYYVEGRSLSLTTKASVQVTPVVSNFNTAMVVQINGNTVASSTPLADGTYGDFGAGLYGTSTLSTLLTALPIGSNARLGYVVNVAGISSGEGALTIGLTQQTIDTLTNSPGAIQLHMNHSGDQIQGPDGRLITGYLKGVAVTTVTVQTAEGVASADLATVFDTGGGPNGVIYYGNSSTPPGVFDGYLPNGSFSLTSPDGETFDSWVGSSPWGGSVAVIGNQAPSENRVNSGGYLFENYVVMYDLESAVLTLVPVPEPSTWTLLAVAVLLVVPAVIRRKSRG